MYNKPLPNKEEIAKADAYCKKKLMPALLLSGWNKWRQKKVKELAEFPTYEYSDEILKFYQNFNGLKIDGLSFSFSYYAEFLEEDGIFTEDLDDNGSQIYEFALLLNQKIFFIGRDRDYSEICIDENFNFYTVSEWGIELWSRRSFYQGLYNLIYRKNQEEGNPYFIRYDIDYKEGYKDHPRDKDGKALWYDYLQPDNEEKKYFTIEL